MSSKIPGLPLFSVISAFTNLEDCTNIMASCYQTMSAFYEMIMPLPPIDLSASCRFRIHAGHIQERLNQLRKNSFQPQFSNVQDDQKPQSITGSEHNHFFSSLQRFQIRIYFIHSLYPHISMLLLSLQQNALGILQEGKGQMYVTSSIRLVILQGAFCIHITLLLPSLTTTAFNCSKWGKERTLSMSPL